MDSDPVRRQGPERDNCGGGGRPRSFPSGPPFPFEVRLRLRRSHDDFERIICMVEVAQTKPSKARLGDEALDFVSNTRNGGERALWQPESASTDLGGLGGISFALTCSG